VFASPVPSHSRPAPSSASAPVDCEGSLSLMGFQCPPPRWERHTPPPALPAYTYPSSSAAIAAIRPVTLPEPPLELESMSR
jgi:hypothetical protein